MGTPILRGREFNDGDRECAPGVAVVSEILAEALWPGEDPLGKRLSFEGRGGPFLEAVGVKHDVKYHYLGDAPRPYVYRPALQSYEPAMTLGLRMAGEPHAFFATVREQVRALDPRLPVADARRAVRLVAGALSAQR